MYLVDSNILIWILRGKEYYVKWFDKAVDHVELSVSTISIGEIYQNVLVDEQTKTEKLIRKFKPWDITTEIAKLAGFYWQRYFKKYSKLNLADCMIAATAREYELDLVTLNRRHFPMHDIKIITP